MLGAQAEIDYLDQNYEIEYEKRMMAEWNMNVYYDIVPTTKTTSINGKLLYGSDLPDYYFTNWPLDVVTKPRRPGSGYCKLRYVTPSAGAMYWHNSQNLNILGDPYYFNQTGITYTLKPRAYYNRSVDKYKYFTQEVQPKHPNYVDPIITYDTTLRALSLNKLVIGFEISQGRPSNFAIKLFGSSWATIFTGTNADIDSSGRVILYWNGSSWTKTPVTSPSINVKVGNISKIWVDVTSMYGEKLQNGIPTPDSPYMNLIEVSPRIEQDMTPYVRDYSWDNNFSESDPVAPIGTVSSGSGTITLDNTEIVNQGHIFEELDPTTINLGSLAKQHAKFTCDIRLARSGSSTWYRQFTAYAQNWKASGHGDSVSVDLLDYSSWLQVEQAPEIVLHRVTPSAAIWRLLDAAGYSNVQIRAMPSEALLDTTLSGNLTGPAEPQMEWFFASNEQTIWDVIKEICLSHQYAVFVDENNIITICTKNYLYQDPTAITPTWTFRETKSGASLPNYTDLESSTTEPLNKVSIKFHPHERSTSNDPGKSLNSSIKTNNIDSTQQLWRPDPGILLGVVDYVGDITATMGTVHGTGTGSPHLRLGEMYITVDSTIYNPVRWGWDSEYFLVDREIIKYSGLEFTYQSKTIVNGQYVWKYLVAKNQVEYEQVYALAVPGSNVSFTGNLCNIERAQFGTTAVAHNSLKSIFTSSPSTGWRKSTPSNGIAITRDPITDDGYLIINGQSTTTSMQTITSITKTFKNGGYFSARMQISPSSKSLPDCLGIVKFATVNASTGNITSGYYAEVQSIAASKQNTASSVVRLYKILGGVVGADPVASVFVNIPRGRWFYLAIGHRPGATTGTEYIKVYLNGKSVISYVAPAGDGILKSNTTNALAVRLSTHALVDFVSSTGAVYSDVETAYIKTMGSYISGIFDSDRGQATSKYLDSLEAAELETFDNKCRQIYIKDIRFDHGPALSTDITLAPPGTASYDSEKGWIAYESETNGQLVAGPYSAQVAVCNTSPRPVVLSRNNENWPFISGYVVMEYTEQQVEKEDKLSIGRIGEHKYDVSPKWVTNEYTAKNMADWVITKWYQGVITVTVTSFPNHLVQLGDTVQLLCPDKGYDTSDYFVVSAISRAWSDGLDSTFTLVQLPPKRVGN